MLRTFIRGVLSEIKTEKTKLDVFDFDSTLFNSPAPPASWDKPRGHWYYDPASLSVDLIGDGSDFWNGGVVADAEISLVDPKSLTILLTGRVQKNFDAIVKDLVEGIGLNFDYVKLSPGGSVQKFKTGEVKNILMLNPGIKTIEFWDDNEKYLFGYKKTFEEMGYEVLTNLIG